MIDWLLEPAQHLHFQRALAICLLAGFANGYLSAFVVLKKAALQTGSLSHSLLPGIALAVLIFGVTQTSAFFGALIAAMIVGLGSIVMDRLSRLGTDTTLAILYTTAFALGLLLLEFAPASVDVEHYLFGNILYATPRDLNTVFWVSAVALLILTALRRPIILMLFEPHSARAIGVPVKFLSYLVLGLLILVLVSTLQAVGCLLALGLLVTPAATVNLLVDRPESLFWGGGVVGALGATIALFLSHHLGVATGSAIVLTLSAIFFLTLLLSPKRGVFATMIRNASRATQ